jgi:hypothetical protein
MISTDSPNEIEELRDAINRKVKAELPAEKARAREEQTKIAQKLAREGSVYVPGLGQKIGSIDARTYYRHLQENPGSMRDPGYIQQLLRDSPKLCAPGYRPRVPRRATYTIVYK